MNDEMARERRKQRYATEKLAVNEFRKLHGMSPAPVSYDGIRFGSVAHNILTSLETYGPMTVKDLGGGVNFSQQGKSAQILRLLDKRMIEHNDIGIYVLTDYGEETLRALRRERTE